METQLADFIKDTRQGKEAERILRACVHCGFCTATCPTYQLLGDELDGPRGRIYQIKQVLEGKPANTETRLHLDRCLTCRNCETTCPSGVQYGRLLDIGRQVVSTQLERPAGEKLLRTGLRNLMLHGHVFKPMLQLGRLLRPVLPAVLKQKVPAARSALPRPKAAHSRKVILAEGCVQPAYRPTTNAAVARVLDKLGIEVITVRGERCCGAVSFHLDAIEEARQMMRTNIDAWWPHIEEGVEAIVSSASGCGVMIKDYGHELSDDPQYADKAERVSALCKDSCELLVNEDLTQFTPAVPLRIAFQSPCTLQHGQKLGGTVEKILQTVGHQLVPVGEGHFCCGSSGTYSILQKDLSQQLLERKIRHLGHAKPQVIATANIGCQLHLESATSLPVRHWIELLDDAVLPL